MPQPRLQSLTSIIEHTGASAVATTGGRTMIKKALYEGLIPHVEREELARLLEIDPGFELQNIAEDGKEFRLILSRKTDLSEKIPSQEHRRSFLS